ncbi:type II toxin-antitoxin system VapC family toxin [Haloferula sp. A504]|uniref:type II toxin-antitoxin system VapC family toxin n=1 Tax=Haloferula sp. A504 TaxID=3373601 RepID=UPI0031C2CF8F|nr:type II toxin-antitoxin system VapC family toxin [Verrucomicrobiaceae bacterium E54]
MTSALLDTVAVLRVLLAPKKLSAIARDVLQGRGLALHYSAINLWEIGIKMSVGGYRDLEIPYDWQVCFPVALQELRATRLEVEPEDCRRIQDLPFHHRDPFDRMLVAQSLERGLDIISPDRSFDAYGVRRIW